MNCEKSREYIMKYFDSELGRDDEEQLRQHLKNCCECSNEFDCMEAIFTTLEEKAEIEPPANFEEMVMDRVIVFEKGRREKSARQIVWLYNAAALLSIILLLVFVADLKQVNLLIAFEQIGEYFHSFSSATSAVFGVVGDLFGLIGNAILVVFDVAISIVKSYYYVFLTLILLLFGIQKLLHYVGTYSGREAE